MWNGESEAAPLVLLGVLEVAVEEIAFPCAWAGVLPLPIATSAACCWEIWSIVLTSLMED